jgi:type IV pilus assembly protein PilM
MDAMCQEALRGLQFFYSSSRHDKVDGIMLCGGCAQIQGIDELLANKVNLPVDIANPFSNMALSPKLKAQTLALDAPSLMVACGLALRGG